MTAAELKYLSEHLVACVAEDIWTVRFTADSPEACTRISNIIASAFNRKAYHSSGTSFYIAVRTGAERLAEAVNAAVAEYRATHKPFVAVHPGGNSGSTHYVVAVHPGADTTPTSSTVVTETAEWSSPLAKKIETNNNAAVDIIVLAAAVIVIILLWEEQ